MKIKSKKSYKNITLSIDIEVPVEDIFDKATVANVGETVKQESIKFMEAGVSPVVGKKFDAYKGLAKIKEMTQMAKELSKDSRESEDMSKEDRRAGRSVARKLRKDARRLKSQTYPFNVMKDYPDKKKTPVNLKLSGNLYDSLSYASKNDTTMTYGLLNPKGKAGIYGPVHNRDDKGRPDIPERKFLPTKPGEEFNKSIMLKIKRLIVERLKKLIKTK